MEAGEGKCSSQGDDKPVPAAYRAGWPLIADLKQSDGRIDRLMPHRALIVLVAAFVLLAVAEPWCAARMRDLVLRSQLIIAFMTSLVTAFALGRDRDLFDSINKTFRKIMQRKFEASDFLEMVRHLVKAARENPFCLSLLGYSVSAMVTGLIVNTIWHLTLIGPLVSGFCFAVLLAALPPLSALAALRVWQHMPFARRLQTGEQGRAAGLLPEMRRRLSSSVRSFLTCRYPYLSGCLSFYFLCAFVSFPLGGFFAQWLHASTVDANIARDQNLSVPLANLITACVFLALTCALRPLALQLSTYFQIFASRLFVHRDSPMEALLETTGMRSSKLELPQAHPHIDSICGTAVWVTFCWACLFFLAGFCPPPLGNAIGNWLQASVTDAGIYVKLSAHPELRLFLASVIAAFGAIPVAVMSCSFLPGRAPQSLIVNKQGILSPSITGLSAFRAWEDLVSITLITKGVLGLPGKKREILCLKFGLLTRAIKLDVQQCRKTEVVELLASADEYAPHCVIAPEVIEIRRRLQADTKVDSLTQAGRFSATIFSPHNAGDSLSGGTYRIIRKLAGKALSAVYLARGPENTHVVVKQFVLPTSAQNCSELCQAFEREYKLLTLLKHEGIARVYDVFEENGARYIAMEHVRGNDLRSIVQRRGPRNPKVVERWAAEMARRMLILHAHDPVILHRDLTPDNIMEDEEGNIKLIDFGAAHQLVEGVTGTLIGKQCYIAPEQLRGRATQASDIYSYGCTLYFLLTGKDPAALKQCDPALERSGIGEKLSELVRRCTAFEEQDRYQSFDQVLAELEGGEAVKLDISQKVELKGGRAL